MKRMQRVALGLCGVLISALIGVSAADAKPIAQATTPAPTPTILPAAQLEPITPQNAHRLTMQGILPQISSGTKHIAFTPDSQYMAAIEYYDGLFLWNTSTWELENTIPFSKGDYQRSNLEFSKDGKFLIFADNSKHNTIHFYEVASLLQNKPALPIHIIANLESAVAWVAFHPDGKKFVSLSINGHISMWDIATRKILETVEIETDYLPRANEIALTFSPDGHWMAFTIENGVNILNLETRTQQQFMRASPEPLLIFHPNSTKLFYMDGSELHVWDILENRFTATISKTMGGASFSHDGKILAVVSDRSQIIILDSFSNRQLEISAKSEGIYSISFSPNGKFIAATHSFYGGGSDFGVSIWSIR
jgi:WD40 repeat protein